MPAKVVEDKVLDCVEDACDEANHYRAEAMDAQGEITRLEERCEELEHQIKEHTCAPIATIPMPGPSIQASRSKWVPPLVVLLILHLDTIQGPLQPQWLA